MPTATTATRARVSLAPLPSLEDADLVRRARDGDERAFEEIVRRYRAPLIRYSARHVGRDNAEDVTQHALAKRGGPPSRRPAPDPPAGVALPGGPQRRDQHARAQGLRPRGAQPRDRRRPAAARAGGTAQRGAPGGLRPRPPARTPAHGAAAERLRGARIRRDRGPAGHLAQLRPGAALAGPRAPAQGRRSDRARCRCSSRWSGRSRRSPGPGGWPGHDRRRRHRRPGQARRHRGDHGRRRRRRHRRAGRSPNDRADRGRRPPRSSGRRRHARAGSRSTSTHMLPHVPAPTTTRTQATPRATPRAPQPPGRARSSRARRPSPSRSPRSHRRPSRRPPPDEPARPRRRPRRRPTSEEEPFENEPDPGAGGIDPPADGGTAA